MRQHRFTQATVDEVRIRVMLAWLRTCDEQHLFPAPMKHLWFPKPDTIAYEMRDGNAPADADRPKHLRGMRLEIDANAMPDWLRNMTRRGGDIDQYIQEQIEEIGIEADSHAIWVAAYASYAKNLSQKKREQILWGEYRKREQEAVLNPKPEPLIVGAYDLIQDPMKTIATPSKRLVLSAREKT